MAIRHVCFDLDGTLYDDTPEIREKRIEDICSSLLERKIDDTDTTLAFDLEGMKTEFQHRLKTYGTNTEALKSFGLSRSQALAIYNKVDVSGLLAEDRKLTDMLGRIVEKDVQVSVFTNNIRPVLEKILKKLGIETRMFSFLLSAENVKLSKPAHDGYWQVVGLCAYSPDRILFVGDRLEADIEPARKVGMHTLLVKSEENKTTYDDDFGTYHVTRKSVYETDKVIDVLNEVLRRQGRDQ